MSVSNEARTPKGERAKQRILDAAETVFSRSGFKAASSSEIAALADVKQPALYHYFDSKEALYSAVLRRAFQPLVDQLTQIMNADEGVPANLPERILDLLAAYPNISRLIFQALLSDDDETGQAIVFEWIETTMQPGNRLAERQSPAIADPQIFLLQAVMITLSHGFFVLRPLLARMFGTAEQSPELLALWKQLLVRVHQWLLTRPLDPAPLLGRAPPEE